MGRARKQSADITPSPHRLLESLRDVGYDFVTAVADIVDNSITAGAQGISVDIAHQEGPPRVTVADDGHGMTRSRLVESLRLGSMREYESDDLGKFGLGLKTASLSQCRRLTVATRHSPNQYRISAATLDLDDVATANRWRLNEYAGTEIHQIASKWLLGSTGTVVWGSVIMGGNPHQTSSVIPDDPRPALSSVTTAMPCSPASESTKDERREATTGGGRVTDVILLVHGIRDFGGWQDNAAQVLEREMPGAKCIPVRYGWFGLCEFVTPWGVGSHPWKSLERAYHHALRQYKQAAISVVAHSNGTHVLGTAIQRSGGLVFKRAILCGAVLNRGYPWRSHGDRFEDGAAAPPVRVLNECGREDNWPLVAEAICLRYGASGAFGFQEEGYVSSRYFAGGHSLFFEPAHIRNVWVPFLRDGVLPPIADQRSPSVYYRTFITIPFLRSLVATTVSTVWAAVTYGLVVGVLSTVMVFVAPLSVRQTVGFLADTSEVVTLRAEVTGNSVPGYTPVQDGNPLFEATPLAINPTTSESPLSGLAEGIAELHILARKGYWHSEVVLETFGVDVSQYEEMPAFVRSREYGAGFVDPLAIGVSLSRRDEPLPWSFPAEEVPAGQGAADPTPHQRVFTLNASDGVLNLRYLVCARQAGVFYVRPWVETVGTDGRASRKYLVREPVALAFYDQASEATNDGGASGQEEASLFPEPVEELKLIRSGTWRHVPDWDASDILLQERYLERHVRQRQQK